MRFEDFFIGTEEPEKRSNALRPSRRRKALLLQSSQLYYCKRQLSNWVSSRCYTASLLFEHPALTCPCHDYLRPIFKDKPRRGSFFTDCTTVPILLSEGGYSSGRGGGRARVICGDPQRWMQFLGVATTAVAAEVTVGRSVGRARTGMRRPVGRSVGDTFAHFIACMHSVWER